MRYIVEVLNLGKRPLADVTAARDVFDDLDGADAHHCRLLGDMTLREGMTVTAAARRHDVGADGIMAAAVLTHDTDGGRVEIILRQMAE